MTETIIAAMQPTDQRISTGGCGPMLPGFVAKVIKADGTLAVAGETGELFTSGKTLLLRIHHSGIHSLRMSSSDRRGCAAIGSDR